MGIEWGGGYARPPRHKGAHMQTMPDLFSMFRLAKGERLIVTVLEDGSIRASHYNRKSERLGVLTTPADLRIRAERAGETS